jgi:hypothetical protein
MMTMLESLNVPFNVVGKIKATVTVSDSNGDIASTGNGYEDGSDDSNSGGNCNGDNGDNENGNSDGN